MPGLKWIGCVATFAFALAADQAAKALALALLPAGEPTRLLGGLLVLEPVRQEGLFFGLLGALDWPWAFWSLAALCAGALLLVLPALWKAPRADLYGGVAIGLILGGAAGNALDWIRLGAVVEYARLELLVLRLPQFNLADCSIFAGIGLLLLDWVVAAVGTESAPE